MELIYPIFTLAIYTIAMVGVLGAVRFVAVQRKQVHPGYFKTFDGKRPPEFVVGLGRNYSNLLEMPILFYLAGVLAIVLNIVHDDMVLCAWAYVISRFAHSVFHIFFNNPLHRLMVFSISVVFLVLMWVMILQQALLMSH